GNTSANLAYQNTTSLALAGGTIKDSLNNSATLTLAALGLAGSLNFNKNIVVDTTGPTVTGVSAAVADGTYGLGKGIPLTVTFNEPVVVDTTGGIPTLTLSTGSPATTDVAYTSGTGTSTLTFTYTVAAGNASPDLDYAATTSLALNGATIKDVATNNATL